MIDYRSLSFVSITKLHGDNRNVSRDMDKFPPTDESIKRVMDYVGRTDWEMTYFLSSRAIQSVWWKYKESILR